MSVENEHIIRRMEFSDAELELLTTSTVIATTFKFYGSIFLICFTVFLVLRAKLPSIYTYNSVHEDQVTKLSRDRLGRVKWIYKIFKHSDEELFESCGLSAIVYLRFLRLGLKLSAWGVFNSIYLLPLMVYGCKSETDECSNLIDRINKASLGNISSRNPSLLGTTVASYILFGKAMHYIFKEFRWFTKWRHKFCIQPTPDNYTVYVGHIPKRYRSDVALTEWFRSIFSHDDVLEAKIALDIRNLEKKVAKRETVVDNLEHALNIKANKSYVPRNIRSLRKELHKLNQEISNVIGQIDEAKLNEKKKFLRDMVEANLAGGLSDSNLSQASSVANMIHAPMTPDDRRSRLKKFSQGSRHLTARSLDLMDSSDVDINIPADFGVNPGIELDPFLNTINSLDSGDVVITLPSESSQVDLNGLDTTSHSDENMGHKKSPTFDSIDTDASMNQVFHGTDVERAINFDTSLVIQEDAELQPLRQRRGKLANGKDHKRHHTFGSFGAATTKSVGSAKKSLGTLGKGVGNAGIHVGKNMQAAYGKTVGRLGKSVAQSKLGKTVAGTVNQSVVVMKKGAEKTVKKAMINTKDLAVYSAHIAFKASNRVARLIVHGDDGAVLESGFVTFSNLSTKQQSLQVVHHEKPFKFHVKDAPLPRDIIWDNVGKPHEEIQFSFWLAQAATVALLLFYTVPVAFFTSLSEAQSLKDLLPTLENTIEKNPWIEPFLAQLSPVLLVILIAVLPAILSLICKYEGHIGQNELKASMMTKLASFMIIQIFFVQAISGSIFDSLNDMLNSPSKVVNLLATAIPKQVKSFIQFVLVQMFMGCSVEVLRLIRVALGFARSRIGPNLTEKERKKKYLFLEPLSSPEEIEYPMLYSELALYFMVNLVYSNIAPIMSYFMVFTFSVLSVVYRHQLIYIYSKEGDKGGQLWPVMIHLLIVCIYVSEITLIGILILKEGIIAGALMVPLFVFTVLFTFYIQNQHFRCTKFVPSTITKEEDLKNYGKLDISFLHNQYLQPALKVKMLFPDNDISEVDVEAPGTPLEKFQAANRLIQAANRLHTDKQKLHGLETVESKEYESDNSESPSKTPNMRNTSIHRFNSSENDGVDTEDDIYQTPNHESNITRKSSRSRSSSASDISYDKLEDEENDTNETCNEGIVQDTKRRKSSESNDSGLSYDISQDNNNDGRDEETTGQSSLENLLSELSFQF